MFPEYLQSLRERLKGRSIADVCRETGLSRSLIHKFLTGECANNRLSTIYAIEAYLNGTRPYKTYSATAYRAQLKEMVNEQPGENLPRPGKGKEVS